MSLDESKLQILSTADFYRVGYDAMRQIFKNDDPFDEPFSDWVSDKILLCEFMYELEQPLLDAVVHAASDNGDKGFFVSLLIDIGASEPHHWYVPFEDIGAYPRIFSLGVENVVFSPSSNWGLIASPEDFAIIGGKPEFMKRLRELAPFVDGQVEEFLLRRQLEAQKHFRIDWVPTILKHVYGEKKSDIYLQTHGLEHKLK